MRESPTRSLGQADSVDCAAAQVGHIEFPCLVLTEGTQLHAGPEDGAFRQPPDGSVAAAQIVPLQ